MKHITILAYSRTGMKLAERTAACLPDARVELYAPARLKEGRFRQEEAGGADSVQAMFERADALVFIGALGIAVRKIAPFVKDKTRDPAVVCMDERGSFVIPVLSGHIGGANELADKLAHALGSTAVITTATDIHQLFSVDTWARQKGLVISDREMAKVISATILEKDIPIECDFPAGADYPPGIRVSERIAGPASDVREKEDCGILISCRIREPFARTLRLIPRIVHLGIGCRKGTKKDRIAAAVQRAFGEQGLDLRGVKGVCSILLKAQEEGLVQYCREMNWPFSVFTSDELMAVPGSYSSSEFVRRTTGADNVCERAAMIGSEQLILPKTVVDGVTVAAAVEHYEIVW